MSSKSNSAQFGSPSHQLTIYHAFPFVLVFYVVLKQHASFIRCNNVRVRTAAKRLVCMHIYVHIPKVCQNVKYKKFLTFEEEVIIK